MNWLVFTLVTFLFLVLENGLRTLLSIDIVEGVSPSFLLVLMVFVGLMANSPVVAWASLLLGIVADLQPGPVAEGVIVGPAALGFLVGGWAVTQLRSLVFRQSMTTLAVMTFASGIFVHLVIVALYTMRGLGLMGAEPVANWSAADQLVRRFLELIYSSAIALPLGWILFRYIWIWGFPHIHKGRERHF